MASAVREVVQNSVDAEATKVEVMLDTFKLKFMVADNGVGIIPGDIDKLGAQNFTSKINNFNDLRSLQTYGFRGEALFCISNVCDMTIISKKKEFNSTWIRKFPNSSEMLTDTSGDVDIHFPMNPLKKNESGTCVLVDNMMYNLPVRRKILQEEPFFTTFMAIKEDLFQLLILHPEINIIINYIDEHEKKHTLLRSSNIASELATHKKISYAFWNIFGSVVPLETMKKVSIAFQEFEVLGLISRCPVRMKDFQFIYINGRRYKNKSFQKVIDSAFQAAGFGYAGSNKSIVKSVGRPFSNHALMIFDVRCPHNVDDLLQDPAKGIFSSSYAHILHPLIIKAVQSFLAHQGYVMPLPVGNNIKDSIVGDRESLCNASKSTMSSKVMTTVLDSKIRMSKITASEVLGRVKGYSKVQKPFSRPVLDIVRLRKLKNNILHYKRDICSVKDSVFDIPKVTHSTMNSDYALQNKIINFNFERSQLNDAEVINQIDKKFVLLKLPPSGEVCYPMLLIVDQHASDERIKLENYLKEFLHEVLNGTLKIELIQNCVLEMDVGEADLFKHFEKEFNKWAIFYNIRAETLETSLIEITSLPYILNVKFNGDKQFLKGALLQFAHDLKSCKMLPITKTKTGEKAHHLSADFEWCKYITCIPGVFREIFNSKACRSAIMFGDQLSKAECVLLIKELAKCQFPFQCAHGRPSVIPIAELMSVDDDMIKETNNLKCMYLDYEIDTKLPQII